MFFKLHDFKSTAKTHPLADDSKIIKKVPTMHMLNPNDVLDLCLKFNAPEQNNHKLWPLTTIFTIKNKLKIIYANGSEQIV